MAAGDINGDGFDDVVAGAPRESSSPSGVRNGFLRVMFGRELLPATLDLGTTAADVTIPGPSFGYVGEAFALGDLNNDGYADIVTNTTVSGPGLDAAIGDWYGSPAIQGEVPTPNRAVRGFVSGIPFGSVSLDDINQDGWIDVIAGAPFQSQAVVLLGGPTFPSTTDLSVTPADITITSPSPPSSLGFATQSVQSISTLTGNRNFSLRSWIHSVRRTSSTCSRVNRAAAACDNRSGTTPATTRIVGSRPRVHAN